MKISVGDYLYHKTDPKKVWKYEGYINGYYVIVRYYVSFFGGHSVESKAICSLDGFIPQSLKARKEK